MYGQFDLERLMMPLDLTKDIYRVRYIPNSDVLRRRHTSFVNADSLQHARDQMPDGVILNVTVVTKAMIAKWESDV
jgi:hypothetical protein